ncbi:hypothetical protein EN962_32875 [Mesorhizobium sp. M7A.F.Ca.CA.001.09.2.1]|nr:hypothetical protein EN981_04350 [Mesorhizobium sp. M7A.F.Ca.CA.001.13.2.1]RUY64984.1 hypothetical protein EN962_32875 [Mesorhizobium sp. M7A.F.Ca.CA.001.09.2.1]RUY68722.1 hypothetical protein EN980_13575 [Mesorhizobium sp. M7A.F.Ca.CA.001.13.1.1]RUY70629.1 hypothetical protein EN965_09560 [Mesorhizobium sp. M7A.F.Ca.CA.001.05.1.1]RUZ06789.1 hypothetical protein EN955_14150 [Mesorhizobium sp. M7A.F.Ca.CA.001.04.2.1]RUZ26055.1 hypothetical protein EN961_02090 [Mesorhizobium sp. M7A.F.Ca.CA.0
MARLGRRPADGSRRQLRQAIGLGVVRFLGCPPILDLFAAPFRTRSRGLLDQRALSDHFKRDIGLLDGHASAGSIR